MLNYRNVQLKSEAFASDILRSIISSERTPCHNILKKINNNTNSVA